MKTKNNDTIKVIAALLALPAVLVTSCIGESIGPVSGFPPAGSFSLSYTIPDSRAAENPSIRNGTAISDTRAVDYVTAVGNESRVADIQLLFFANDDHGNGTYITTLTATPVQPTTGTSEKTDVTYTGRKRHRRSDRLPRTGSRQSG